MYYQWLRDGMRLALWGGGFCLEFFALVSCLVWACPAFHHHPGTRGFFLLSGKLNVFQHMTGFYAQWMERWEHKLATRDTNRVVRPFDWGTDWLNSIGHPQIPANTNGDSAVHMRRFVNEALADSDRFFSYEPVSDYRMANSELTFTSAVQTRYPENNTVRALWFPVPKDKRRALIVLPQWNSGPDGHVGLAKLLNRFGISALRMTMAYHAERKPAETERADYHCSANVGRTIHAGRQSVIDARGCIDWLVQQGYERIGILGTSLGSCVAFITAAHDRRVQLGIFNHVSMYFSDVVWTGLSTKFVRDSFASHVSQDELRHYWSLISPASYLRLLQGRNLKTQLIWASHDSTFLPVYSKQVLKYFRENRLPHEVFHLPCGHYTTGQFPFNLIDGLAMCRFAARHL
jgi:Alpha/beta hydrolase domain containing 18